MCLSQLPEAYLKHRRVFLRADLNIQDIADPSDHYRLYALKPTLDLLLKKEARVILATHRGRPGGEYKSELSTRLLVPWFIKQGYTCIFAKTLEQAQTLVGQLTSQAFVLLENLRFYPGEQVPSIEFAQQLRALADYYVNDAFGLLHRQDTSITLLPQLFAPLDKTIGLRVELELRTLKPIRENPARPLIYILGGGKIHDKIIFVQRFLSPANSILLCPALDFTFLQALGKVCGRSLTDPSRIDLARTILNQAHEQGSSLMFPLDYLVSVHDLAGPLEHISAEHYCDNGATDAIGIAIGPETVEYYAQKIDRAGTVIYNGAMGFHRRPETQAPFYALLRRISQSPAYTLVGGGDSVAAVYHAHLQDKIDFCSTGGGAMLAYLSSAPLPGLSSVCDHP